MLINIKKLLGLPVITKSGETIGEVDDLELDIDEQMVVNYLVGSKNPIKNLFNGKLLVSRNQVVSISEKEVVVDDNVLELSRVVGSAGQKTENILPEGAATSTLSDAK